MYVQVASPFHTILVLLTVVTRDEYIKQYLLLVDPGGRANQGVGLRPLALWDCGFISRRECGSLSLVSVVSCKGKVSETGRSLAQRSSTKCVCVCVYARVCVCVPLNVIRWNSNTTPTMSR
jgi:hypothetical protein